MGFSENPFTVGVDGPTGLSVGDSSMTLSPDADMFTSPDADNVPVRHGGYYPLGRTVARDAFSAGTHRRPPDYPPQRVPLVSRRTPSLQRQGCPASLESGATEARISTDLTVRSDSVFVAFVKLRMEMGNGE